MNAEGPEMNGLTERIIGCALAVSRTLGCGFLERVYENALAHEFTIAGLRCAQQVGLTVAYKGISVGDYVADFVVEDTVLLELKAVPALLDAHRAQCLNYLRATGLHLCLLMNFGKPRLEIRRIVLDLR